MLVKLILRNPFKVELPMFHAGWVIGLPEPGVERVDRNDAIAVYAKPGQRPCCLHCRRPRTGIRAKYPQMLKHPRQGIS